MENIDSDLNTPLIDTNANNILRRSTFIPTPENDHSEDEQSLKEMGFEEGMVKKVYLFLKPNNINEAIDLMSEINGIYQHDFYENPSPINHECFICKSEKQYHRD